MAPVAPRKPAEGPDPVPQRVRYCQRDLPGRAGQPLYRPPQERRPEVQARDGGHHCWPFPPSVPRAQVHHLRPRLRVLSLASPASRPRCRGLVLRPAGTLAKGRQREHQRPRPAVLAPRHGPDGADKSLLGGDLAHASTPHRGSVWATAPRPKSSAKGSWPRQPPCPSLSTAQMRTSA